MEENNNEVVETKTATATASPKINLNWSLILTLVSFGFLFLRYIFMWTVTSDAVITLSVLFFSFAFLSAFSSLIVSFFVTKKEKFDPVMVLSIVALVICFL